MFWWPTNDMWTVCVIMWLIYLLTLDWRKIIFPFKQYKLQIIFWLGLEFCVHNTFSGLGF